MPVAVTRRAPASPKLATRVVRTRAERMLRELGLNLGQVELSILLTDDPQIEALNRKHRKKPRPTDVLAFPIDDESPHTSVARLLGDVVISVDTAARQAQKRHHPLIDEVTHLLAHGVLHLIGYDHRTDAQERRMNAATKRLIVAATGGHAQR